MPFDALGNYIPDDEVSLDAMKYELAKKGTMPLRPSGSDIPYVASEVPSIRVPVTPKEPPKPYSSATNFPQAVADRLGISAIPQALMAMGTGFASEVAKGIGQKEASQAMRYEPTSRVATDVLAGLEEAPRAITGSHMGFGPMPETWVTGMGSVSPSDVRVLGKQAIERGRELRAIPEDFRSAQAGLKRESNLGGETYGAKLQGVAEDIGDVMARQEARRNRYETSPRSSVEVFGDMVPESNLYAVRNTGEGQLLRPSTTPAGVEPRNVDYGETEQFLREISPPLSVNKPEDIIDQYERTYMSENTPEVRALNYEWERFQTNKIKELYPPNFTQADAFKAFRSGYPVNVMNDMKLKWFHDFVAQEKAKGAPIPTMEEYFARAQSAHTLTNKIIPNIIQKYIGTPNDPFLESAKKGITMNPAEELADRYELPTFELQDIRRKAGFEPEGEVANKLMPVAEAKLATQSQELDRLISEQNQIGQTEGMMVPYPDGRIDPETGAVMLATNPNYAQYTNKIGAMRKLIEDSFEEVRNLKLAQAYENVSDSAIRTGQAYEYRNRIAPEEQQFYPSIFGEKPLATPDAEREFKTPASAPFFDVNVHGLTRAGILPLAKDLVKKILSGEIPPEQVPSLSQPHTITKFMADIVAPRIEKEKAARLAMKDYRKNVENHFVEVLNNIPDSMKVGTNAKLLWMDDATPEQEILQNLSDETFVLDHCIGQSGNGRGVKNLFTGDERSYIPMLDPATKQKFNGAGYTSSYMDSVISGEKDIMSIRDDQTGIPVGTIELSRDVDKDGEVVYNIGYVSGYKNHNNKFKGIDPKYREALRDSLNLIKNQIASSDGNETKSGVYDMRDNGQMGDLQKALKLPQGSYDKTKATWNGVKQYIMDTLDGDRYITLEQAEEALKEYKQANPPVPAVRSGFPPAGKEITERNIVMQGLSRENLNTSRQFDAARIVADNNLFTNLPSTATMQERPRLALQTILRGEERRADAQGTSDYQLFRNLQEHVDEIANNRPQDYNLMSRAESDELANAVQRHADAIGQLAHYADVLQRNGYRSPLPSENLNTPEWQAYQRFMDELALDNPSDLRTRLRDMIEHGDPRELNANLDAIQVENFKHLLEIHIRALEQAEHYPAPTAPAEQRGIPLAQWSDVVFNALNRIETDHGLDVRSRVGEILADAIGSQIDTPVNERPIQVANFLENARLVNGSQQVRRGLRTLQSEIERANADIQNARNAPQTPALPTSEDFRNAVLASINDMSPYQWADVSDIFERIKTEITDAGGLPHQQPTTLVNRLNEQAQLQDVGGEPDTAQGLRNLANRIAQLVPANPPASMALANQNAIRNQPARDLVAGQEALSNSILDVMNDTPAQAADVSDRLNALQWRENLVNDPAGLVRNIRIEADAEANAGNESLASSFYDIANLIADERGETLFTPAGRQVAEPRRTPRDIAETISAPVHQSLTQRIAQVDALANGINEEIRSIPASEAGLRQAELFYSDPNNLPASIVDYTHQYEDAERISNFLLQHVRSRMVNRPNAQMDLNSAIDAVANEIRNTYTDNYLQQFNDGDVDVRNTVLQDVADRPAVYGISRATPEVQRQVVERLRTEGLPANLEQIPAPDEFNPQLPAPTADFPTDDQFRTIARAHTNEFTGSQDSFYRIGRDLRNMTPQDRLGALDRMVRDTSRNAGLDEGMRNTYGVDSPAGMSQLNNALIRLREDLRDRDLLTQLQAPSPANDLYNNGRINGAIHNRIMSVNREHLGISQRFDTIVNAARNEFDPVTDPVNFISSLHHRANSIDSIAGITNESRILANQLRHLADDVNDVLHTQAPALPAPDQEVNQPRVLGALDRNDRNLINGQSVNFLNGDQNALRQLSPVQRELAEVLTRAREPDPTLINELIHRRLINTLTSETYSPTTDGEALVRLADTRSGMFAELDDPAREQVKDIIEKWNFSRFPNYRPPEEGMGLEPEGRKRGGVIRKKMFMTEGGKVLTPYEQFKIDNAERIRQGQEDIANRNKYDPYKGSDQPINNPRAPKGASGSAGTMPSGSGASYLDRPHLYAGGGSVDYQNPEDRGGFFDYSPGYYHEVANKINPEGQGGGYNDATRHILASADMTRRFGEIPASLLGYGHEAWNYLEGKFNGRPQTNEDMQQDLHNNAVGRQIGKNASSFQDIVNRVPQAIDVRPYQKQENKAFVRHPNEAKTPYKPFGAFAQGGVAHMNEGGLPEDIGRALKEGRITQNQAEYIHNSRLNPVPAHWGDHMSYQDRYNESLEPKPKYVPPTEQQIRTKEFLDKQDPMRQANVDMNREQLRQHALQTQNPATFRANPARVGGGGGGGGSADIKQFMNPRNIAYQDGGDVNIDAMRLALMKG